MQTHPSNLIQIDGAVFDGAYEGLMRRFTAAEWMARYGHNPRAGVAIRQVRNGERETASFRADDGVTWNLRIAA